MSGTFTVLPLTCGKVPTDPTVILYTSAATTYLKGWLLFNETSFDVTVTLYLVPAGGAGVPFRQVVLGAQESYKALEHGESITLGVGDGITAVADTAGVIDYSLTGVTET